MTADFARTHGHDTDTIVEEYDLIFAVELNLGAL